MTTQQRIENVTRDVRKAIESEWMEADMRAMQRIERQFQAGIRRERLAFSAGMGAGVMLTLTAVAALQAAS